MRKLLYIVALIPCIVSAGVMPTVKTPSGYDRVKTSDGLTCESSVASDTYIQTGIYSVNSEDSAVFAQVVIPLTGARKRLDCSKLYDLELRARAQEIELLKKQLELMSNQGVKVYE